MKITMDMASDKKAGKKEHQDYEVESAVRTLLEAEKIKGDKQLMDLVHERLGKHKEAIKSIQGLKDRYSKMTEDKVQDNDEDGE